MVDRSGYRFGADVDEQDEERRLTVFSCGYYRMVRRPFFETLRPEGRRDYQLLCVAGGSGRFLVDGVLRTLGEGSIVLYRPGQEQYYCYRLEDRPEVYWVHFSGYGAEELLCSLGFTAGVYDVPFCGEYAAVFKNMIQEMQVKRRYFEDLTALQLQELLTLVSRGAGERREGVHLRNQQLQPVVERIHRDLREDCPVTEYAAMCNMSVCWFIRSFKSYTGLTPQQFVIDARITRAKELLADTRYNITEVASLVGYDNPLYFSRLFKKNTGMSPREFRAKRGTAE
jgi:AraC family transcriptional regulator of arabinose operon